MGKIFGISDLPVSTIMTPFEPITTQFNPSSREIEQATKIAQKLALTEDKFIPKQLSKAKTSKFLDMRNGFGKLMKHFSKKI